MSWAEAKWVVDTLKQQIGQPPNNMRAFQASPVSTSSIGLTFLEPDDSYADGNLVCSVGGVMIRMGTDGYPTKPTEGELVIDNKELGKYEITPYIKTGLTEGQTYYFSAFPYSSQGVYNLSGNEANRASAQALSGEKAVVTITIDNPVAFESVIITCVDETDPDATRTATLTPEQKTTTFTVPIGDTYHIEYGEEEGYSKPENTEPKVSVAGATSNYEATYSYFTATIQVTYPEGATTTCSDGVTTYTAEDTTGSYTFSVHNAGTWTITAVNGEESASTEVIITESGQSESVELSFVKIYGISRDITLSSPDWARTDDAVGMTATASVGTVAGSSDFDTCYPWSGIVRETLSTGDVMVKIPKFWYRRYREGNIEYIKIAEKPVEGFKVHPAFDHVNRPSDYVYVGAYRAYEYKKDGEDYLGSLSGKTPMDSLTYHLWIYEAEKQADGWSILDLSTFSAIQMLILVEFATNDVQTAIGYGRNSQSTSTELLTGVTDEVPNLTGQVTSDTSYGKTNGVVWRGIEDIWGCGYSYCVLIAGVALARDGLFYLRQNDLSAYDHVDPDYIQSDENAHSLSTPLTTEVDGNVFITKVSFDEDYDYVMLPIEASGGSDSTFYCDKMYSTMNVGDTRRSSFLSVGGQATNAGLFYSYLNYLEDVDDYMTTARLLYIPTGGN